MRSVGLTKDITKFPNTCSFCRRVMKRVFFLCSWTLHSKEKNVSWLILTLFSSIHLDKPWSQEGNLHCRCHPTQSRQKEPSVTLLIYYATSATRECVQFRWQSPRWAPCIHFMGMGGLQHQDTILAEHKKSHLQSSQFIHKGGAGLFTWMHGKQDTRQQAQAASGETPSRHEEKLLTMRRIKQRSPEKYFSLLEIAKTQLSRALNNLIQGPAFSRRLDQMISRGPFQPRLFCDSCVLIQSWITLGETGKWDSSS